MNKGFKLYAAAWLVLVAVFNVIIFALPAEIAGENRFDAAFSIAYSSVMISFAGQAVCAFIVFKENNLRKLFYKMSLVTVSYTGLIASVAFGLVCMISPFVPSWIALIFSLLILGVTFVAVITAKASADIVEAVDEKVKAKTLFIKALTADAEGLIARTKTEEIKAECRKVYEAVRYSDPMSNPELSDIEAQITAAFSKLSAAVAEGNSDKVKACCGDMLVLVSDRNKKCKILKNLHS